MSNAVDGRSYQCGRRFVANFGVRRTYRPGTSKHIGRYSGCVNATAVRYPLVNSVWNILSRIWLTIGLWLIVFMEVSTPSFILQYDLRPNYLFAEYLIYPHEVFSMLWSNHRAELVLAAGVSMATLYMGWRIFGRYNSKNGSQPRWYERPIMAAILFCVVLLAARSTLQHRPINPSYTAFPTIR